MVFPLDWNVSSHNKLLALGLGITVRQLRKENLTYIVLYDCEVDGNGDNQDALTHYVGIKKSSVGYWNAF